ncbi:MAG: DUF262 domain-containing HNH endonuclease family protein [Hyphomicrobium aestuarii]|nr:DUF262 domain-containing HNH endonuclease family protein [Hyphomicrobium aestuarii]
MFTGLKTDSLVLSRLFDEPYAFAIPSYQRSYSWTTREVGQLLEDVTSAAGIEELQFTCPDYFLGTVLLLDPNTDQPNTDHSHVDQTASTSRAADANAIASAGPAGSQPRLPYEVVDGQQRLLTVSLLASVLEAGVEDEGLASRLRSLIIDQYGRPRIDVFNVDRDREVFISRVVAAAGVQAARDASPVFAGHGDGDLGDVDDKFSNVDQNDLHGEILDRYGRGELTVALDYLRQEVSALSPADQRALALYLIERCHVVVIITRDIDRAHLLFTVLNDRGRPLQRKDILKVEVLKSIEPTREREALARWDSAAQKLGNDFESLFSHIRLIHSIGRPQIISAMRGLVRQHGCLPFLERVLTPMADAFYLIRRFPEDPRRASEYPDLAKALTSLNRFGNADWVAPAMIAMSRFEDDPAGVQRTVVEIERLTFLLKVLSIGGAKRTRRANQLIQALTRGNCVELDQAFTVTREEQRAVMHHLRDIHRRDAALAKLILMRIEEELSGTPLLLSTSELTVEHILPQRPTPTSDWRRLFGERREACQHSLGNLALVPPRANERMRNKEFAVKLAIFAATGPRAVPAFRVNEDVVEAVEWTPEQVFAREARLMSVLARLWRIDGLGQAREIAPAAVTHRSANPA